jgi:glycine/D-amino acid oxidase-like deaminating enzyme
VIVGGGYTGLSTALHLARDHGMVTAVLEAGEIGWGASGRNGGFCVPGGSKISLATMARRYGKEEAAAYVRLTHGAVDRVAGLLADEQIDASVQPGGEYTLAHSRKAMASLESYRDTMIAIHGHVQDVKSPQELKELGLHSPVFHGGLHDSIGFGLHPLDYVRGLQRAALRHGVRVFHRSRVQAWAREDGRHILETERGVARGEVVVFATGGYPPKQIARSLAERLFCVPSNIIATRPLTRDELDAQGWTSNHIACDSRSLLHYFRLLKDGRFIFGARGGLGEGPDVEVEFRKRLEQDFRMMFPAWRDVEITHFWRGLLDMALDRMPHCSALDGDPTVLAGCAFHGSGVSLGTEIGAHLAGLAARRPLPGLPSFMRKPPPSIPLPGLRPLYLSAAIAGYGLADALH